MANYLYNGIELPALPTWDSATYPAAVVARCLSDEAISIYGGEYALVFGTRPQWNNGNLDMYGFHKLYYASGDEWVYQFGSDTSDVLDIAVADFIEVVWTNTDIYTEDGTSVYLAASEPTIESEDNTEETTGMTDNMKAFVKMLLCGLVSKGVVKESEKTPIAYSYNGVVLPKLPEWDKEAYPYAVIYQDNNATNPYYTIVVSANACYVKAQLQLLTGKYDDVLKWEGEYVRYSLFSGYEDWAPDDGSVYEDFVISASAALDPWTNIDIHYADDYSADETLAGTLYLAASEPVPVYE